MAEDCNTCIDAEEIKQAAKDLLKHHSPARANHLRGRLGLPYAEFETHDSVNQKQLKIFVAGPSGDLPWVGNIIKRVHDLGHDCFDWTIAFSTYGPNADRRILEQQAIKDLAHVAEADGVIWLESAKFSEGAPLEVGFAHGRGIPVVSLPHHIHRQRFYRNLFPEASDVESAIDIIKDQMVIRQ